MKKLPSMAAIAEQAGVAKSTVSLALRNDPRVSPAKRDHIQKVATDMGYQANALVSRLMFEMRKTRRKKYLANLAAINASTTPPEILHAISNMKSWQQGLLERSTELGYGLDHFWLHSDGFQPKRLANILRARNIQGVIFYGLQDEDYLLDCEEIWNHFSTVTIGVHLRVPPLNFVINDHYYAAYNCCLQIQRCGYRRIGIVLDRWLDVLLEHRYIAGYRAALPEGSELLPTLYLTDGKRGTQPIDPLRKKMKERFRNWLEATKPDAILCINYYVLEWLEEFGMNQRKQLGVALLDRPQELEGIVAGMDPRSVGTGMKTIDVLVGQINRGEFGLPQVQSGTMIESEWSPGPTVRLPESAANISNNPKGLRKERKRKT